jgi:hypothetical protein
MEKINFKKSLTLDIDLFSFRVWLKKLIKIIFNVEKVGK